MSDNIENRLIEICKVILDVEDIDVNDNFFQLGGHSLKAIELECLIEKEFIIEIPISEIFKSVTIKEMANYIKGAKNKEISNILSVENIECRELLNNYMINNQDNSPRLMNEVKGQNIFIFPPIGGYGYIYKNFAQLINEYTIYAFDFIEDGDIDMYVREITNIQESGSYILMGYSMGGNLAFEVTKSMEAKGYKVSDLILIDSLPRKDQCFDQVQSEALINDAFNSINNYINIDTPLMNDYVHKLIEKKIRESCKFYNKMINNGSSDANFYLITSNEMGNYLGEQWNSLTEKTLKIYNGHGNHYEMINSEKHLKLNCKIVNQILKSINK